MTYSLRHLRYFVTIADTKSFSKAAKLCHVTQSTLSLGLKELERQMNLPLLERTRGNIIPTPAGQEILKLAKDILRQSDRLADAVAQLDDPLSGPLRIGAIPTVAPYILPRSLPVLEQSFPHSPIHIAEEPTAALVDKVESGELDLGVLAFPADTRGLETRILFTEDFVAAAPSSMDIGDTIKAENLDRYDMLLLRDGHCLKDHILSACRLPPDKQNMMFGAESLHTLLAMVNQGYGMTLLPRMALENGIHKPFPNLRIIPFASPAPSRQIGLVWRRSDVRALIFETLDF